MKIIISGYGKMGKEIEKIARNRNHEIEAILDTESDWENLQTKPDTKPVIVDFSQPGVVVNNIRRAFIMNLPVVVGTTGWNKYFESIKEHCIKNNQTLFTASNFSIGMNLFFAVNSYLARLMADKKIYDVSVSETHHIHKLDKPSGTAISLAEEILKNISRKKRWTNAEKQHPGDLTIRSIREGEIIGKHNILYSSEFDEIEIRHAAKNRRGFAMGAIMAAEWVAGKKGVFEMKDMLGI